MYIAFYVGQSNTIKAVAQKFGYGIWDGRTLWFQDGSEFETSEVNVLLPRDNRPFFQAEKYEMVSSRVSLPKELLAFTKHPQYPDRCRTWEWIRNNTTQWTEAELYRAYLFWRECKMLRELRRLKSDEQLPSWELYDVWNRTEVK